jgi:hypothetical protein
MGLLGELWWLMDWNYLSRDWPISLAKRSLDRQILKKQPILKSYAIKQPNLNNNEVNAVSTVTKLVAEPISITSESSLNSKVNVDALQIFCLSNKLLLQ